MPPSEARTSASHRARHRPLPAWKKLAFSAIATLFFFVAMELGLALIGVRPVLYEEDPFVGFAPGVPLFVEKVDETGLRTMVTAENRLNLFNHQQFPADKAKGVCRIFCMGGSTTYGRPYDDTTSFAGWLREFLPTADPSHTWEVVNAGGISYASYRVAMLMEELTQYEPDLFIVYCGHNEFLERRTYSDLIETPVAVRQVQSLAGRTRTFSALRRLLHQDDGSGLMSRDGRDLLPAEVDAILDQSFGPEEYHRDDEWQEQVERHYRLSLLRMVAIARSSGAEILFVTPASNLRDFTPFKSEHSEGLSEESLNLFLGYMQAAADAFTAKQFEDALDALDQAEEIDPRHAQMQFLRGRVLARLGRHAEAYAAFQRARDEDVCPLRALTSMQQIVRDVGRAETVPVIDFTAKLDEQAEDGIPGADLFLDHVHPKINVHRELALNLVEEMEEMGFVDAADSWNQAAVDAVSARVYGGLNSAAHANALRNLSKVLGWAGKSEEAEQLALLAVLGLPGDANAHYMAGMAHRRQGCLEAAVRELKKAVELSPTYVTALRALGSALIEQGNPQQAVQYYQKALELEPSDFVLHSDMGFLYLSQKDFEAASDHFQLALIINPENALSYTGLGQVEEARGDRTAALECYQQALKLDPEDLDAGDGVARCRP